MKTRNGFVSNSSTSSFVVVVKKEHHEKVMEEVHPFIKACILALEPSVKKFNNEDVITFGTMDTQGGSQWEWIEVDYDGDMEGLDMDAEEAKYDSVHIYTEKGKKLFGKKAVLTISIGN